MLSNTKKMKKIRLLILLLTMAIGGLNAQIFNPVKWEFSAKQTGDKTYEIRLKARIEKGWQIYSQDSPSTGPIPTKIEFDKNRSMLVMGKAKETGKQHTKYEEVFKSDALYYHDSVIYIQLIKFKKKFPKNITGVVTFMACKDDQCLPPEDVEFTIEL